MEFCIGAFGVNLRKPEGRQHFRSIGAHQLSFGEPEFMGNAHTQEELYTLRNQLDEEGLRIITSHPSFESFNNPFSTLQQDPERLQIELEWMKEFIVRCGILGVHAFPLHTGGGMLPNARQWEVESVQRYIDVLLPVAQKANVIIAIENTNHATPIGFYPHVRGLVPLNRNIWEFDDSVRIVRLIEHYQSPYVRICYDTGHSHLLGRMMADLNLFLPYIALYHIHDNDGVGNDAHLQPGYGNAPWGAFFERIGKNPAPLFVEAGPYHRDPALMLKELQAIADGSVIVKEGGFLKKDEDTQHIIITERKEVQVC